ncbi:MAG TPA: AAA family ATPase [Azospirillaceae bacterium]|nr:AAA family ATPase [Azospirillaceae bacterium]
MRPLRLVLTAFGPFAGSQEVDFRLLRDLRLFLINGPVGAGKTTVLDGICYALYGESSGEERQHFHLRSHLAPGDRATEVVFDFAVGERAYRVQRRPEQERAKQRGQGTTRVPAEAALWDRTGCRDDVEEGKPLAARVREVDEAVANLLGFTAAEFRQVVMLPQGRFREMLAADSGDREKILKVLFQTGRYAEIEQRLKDKAKAARVRLESLARHEQAVLAQAGAESLDEIRNRMADLDRTIAQAEGAVATLRGDAELRRKAVEDAARLAEQFQALDRAEAERAAVESERPGHAAREAELAAARRAAHIRPVEVAFARAAAEADRARTDAEAATAALEAARATATAAEAARTAQEAREPERIRAAQRLAELEAHHQRIAQLDALHREAKAAADAVMRAEQGLAMADARLVEADRSAPEARARLAAVERAAAGLDGARLRLDEEGRRLRQRTVLAEATEALAALDMRLEAGRMALAAAEAAHGQADDALRRTERAWLDGQAALLAARLRDGEPCPVCGAVDHPAPAGSAGHGAASGMPTEPGAEQAVEAARAALAAAAKRVHDVRAGIVKVEAERQAKADRIAQAMEALGPDAAADPADLARRETEARRALDTAEAAVRGLAAARDAADRAEAALTAARAQRQTAAGALSEARMTEAAARARVEERLQQVPVELRAGGALAAALAAARREADRLKADLDGARKAAAEANERKAAAAARDDATREALARALAARDEALEVFNAALPAQGFADADAYRRAVRDPAAVPILEAGVEGFRRRDAASAAALDGARAAVAGRERPDMAALRLAHADAQQAVQARHAEVVRAGEQRRLLDRAVQALGELAAARADGEAEWSTVQRLADVANGANPLGLSFQRFVLGALLDQVLESANRRLQVMSRGRYGLRRAEEAERGRRKAGLDLDVLDSHTDRPRSVRTLSGGEGFLAALSLALGVVDVVQAYAGGIRVDTLFIDEGFGSLDSDALDSALQALLDLQSSGRLVGVISHVGDLKERIAARLDVAKSPSGSRAAFLVP